MDIVFHDRTARRPGRRPVEIILRLSELHEIGLKVAFDALESYTKKNQKER